jgi:hypothetical protein
MTAGDFGRVIWSPVDPPNGSGTTSNQCRIVAELAARSLLLLIGQSVVASTAVGAGHFCLPLCGGPTEDQPVPAVVRCRERRQDVWE